MSGDEINRTVDLEPESSAEIDGHNTNLLRIQRFLLVLSLNKRQLKDNLCCWLALDAHQQMKFKGFEYSASG